MSAKKALGRGLDALSVANLLGDEFDPTAAEDEQLSELTELSLTDIIPDPNQPRRTFDPTALAELSDSIKSFGVLQPIVVTKKAGKYQIVAGERRFRAAKLAGLTTIPAIIRDLSGQQRLEASIIENVQREDLSVIEIATAYAKLRDQFNLSTDDIAKKIHKSPSSIVNTIRLLKLPDLAKKFIVSHHLSEGQVRPLVALPPEAVESIIPKVATEGWSARKVEQFSVDYKAKQKSTQSGNVVKNSTSSVYDAKIRSLEQKFKNTKIQVLTSARGTGKLVIHYKTPADLDKILTAIEK